MTLAKGLALIGGAAVALTMSVLPKNDTPSQEQTRTLTGCLRSGSAASVYIVRSATSPAAEGERRGIPEDYLVVSFPNGANPNDMLNHRVEVTGLVSDAGAPPPPPAAANAAEKSMKKITVRGIKEVANSCGEEAR